MKNGTVTFYGDISSDYIGISSSIHYGFETYRNEFINIMKQLDDGLQRMKLYDSIIPQLKDPHSIFEERIKNYSIKWEKNELILHDLLDPLFLHLTYAISDAQSSNSAVKYLKNETLSYEVHPANFINLFHIKKQSITCSYDNFEQILIHLNRDWTENGETLRNDLYKEGIIQSLQEQLLHENSEYPFHILVPGAGLGRLAIELAAVGYRVEANEISSSMLTAFYSLLNKYLFTSKTQEFYPFLSLTLRNDWNFQNRLNPVPFPNYQDSPLLNSFLENYNKKKSLFTPLSVQYGDFFSVYGRSLEQFSRFDAIVTCFFIDAATDNLPHLLAVITHVLKPGGVWVNAGPLQYHSQSSIFYSYSDIIALACKVGFSVASEKTVHSFYGGEQGFSMKPELYHVPITVFRFSNPSHRIPLPVQLEVSNGKHGDNVKASEGFNKSDGPMDKRNKEKKIKR